MCSNTLLLLAKVKIMLHFNFYYTILAPMLSLRRKYYILLHLPISRESIWHTSKCHFHTFSCMCKAFWVSHVCFLSVHILYFIVMLFHSYCKFMHIIGNNSHFSVCSWQRRLLVCTKYGIWALELQKCLGRHVTLFWYFILNLIILPCL